jgi:hypothetical protein
VLTPKLCAIESVSGFEGRRKGATGSFLALNCGNDHGELENVHARFDAGFFLVAQNCGRVLAATVAFTQKLLLWFSSLPVDQHKIATMF